MGSKMMLKWPLIGAFTGFFVLHPFVMVISHLMMEPRLTHDHSIFEMVTSEILRSFSIKMLPWSLTFAIFGALVGFFQGRGRQAGKALEISEERYKTLIDNSLTGVFIHQDGKYVFLNDRFAEIHGYKPEELMGREYLELIHPDEREIIEETVSKRLKGETVSEQYEVRRLRKDKKAVWCEMMATTIEYKGSPAILGNIIDITDRKQVEETLKESEDRFRSISVSAKDAIVMMDNDGNVSYWNPAAEKMFGHTTDEAIGKKLHMLLAPERYREAYLEGFSAFKKTGRGAAVRKTLELEGVRKDGKEFPVELSMNAIRIKGQWHAVGIMRDITKRKRAEEKLEKQTHNLGERVKELQCLYGISKLLETPDASLENIVQGTVNLIPTSWQYPEITCAQVVFDGQEFKTEGFRKTAWKLVSDILVGGKPIGSVQVYYQEEKPEQDEGPFMKEERRLLDAIAERLATIIELRQVGNGLKRTHDQLEEANKKLGFAYAQMRDWRDRLGTQLHGEEIGFLIDEKGKILGVTEKAMESTGQSRIQLLRSNISDLVDEEDKYEVNDNIKKAWGGVFRKSFFKVIRKGSSPQKFETKFMRVSPEHGRMLLVLMRESDGVDETGDVD